LILVTSFFCTDTPTPKTYTLSLHDALPISHGPRPARAPGDDEPLDERALPGLAREAPVERAVDLERRARLSLVDHARSWHVPTSDRKSTRLNSSHVAISYAVFCLKKKNQIQ